MKTFRIAVWVGVLILAGFLGWVTLNLTKSKDVVAEPPFGVPFTLVSQNGQPITEEALRGKPTALFFGFTHCPEVCPTTLFELNGWMEKVDPKGDKLQAYFVTVDPERDTPETLKTYLESFDSRIIGLSGSPEQIKAVEAAFEAPLGKDADKGGRSHSSAFFLMDKYGLLAKPIDYTEPQEIENMAKRLLKQ